MVSKAKQKMSRRQYLLLLLLVILLVGVIFQKQLATHLKIALFITEEFPQIPVKPLGILTANPQHEKVDFETSNGKVVADLFIPKAQGKKPALIVAMGIKTAEDDKPLILKFSDTLSRLGYVVFWPRLKVLDEGVSLPEEPETFIKSFEYLSGQDFVKREKISFIGFSVGSSVAMKAAEDPTINDKVHGLIFFGGYFDVFDYYVSLSTKTTKLNGQILPWDPAPDAVDHAKGLLKTRGADRLIKIFEATSSAQAYNLIKGAPQDEIDGLKKYNPKEKPDQFKASIFILHDKSDTYVPYVESIKLDRALSQHPNKTFLITDLFEHVQPNRPINIGELVKLYGFLYKVFSFL